MAIFASLGVFGERSRSRRCFSPELLSANFSKANLATTLESSRQRRAAPVLPRSPAKSETASTYGPALTTLPANPTIPASLHQILITTPSPTLLYFATTLSATLPTLRSIYIGLGNTYSDLHPCLHNNPLIPLGTRDLIAAELAPHPLPHNSHQAFTTSPFQQVVFHLENCAHALNELAEQEGTVHEPENLHVSIAVLLVRAGALQQRADELLQGLWGAVEAHVRLGRWMASRGIWPSDGVAVGCGYDSSR